MPKALELVIKGMTEKTLSFAGEHFRFDKVPMEIAPFQKPHPPLWYGVHSPDAAERAARRGLHTDQPRSAGETKICADRYRAVWRETRGDAPLPKLGLGRFIVVADTDEAALALARRAYPKWHDGVHLPAAAARDHAAAPAAGRFRHADGARPGFRRRRRRA